MDKKSILIFGAGDLQRSLIENAKELGFYVIAIDPNPMACARDSSDEFIVVQGDDFKGTLEIAKRYKVKGLITAATDKPLLMMARVADELSLPFPSVDSIENTINKGKLKQILIKHDLLCAQGRVYDTLALPMNDQVNFPVIIKPVSSSGSRGVVLCETSSAYDKAIESVLEVSNGEIIIEEFIKGYEVSVEGLVYNGEVIILQITDKKTTNPPYNVELEHIQPSIHKFDIRDKIQEYLQKLINELNLDNCAIHPEFKINEDGVFLLEMGPRLGGDYMTSHLVKLSTGVNMEQTLIKIATNEEFDINHSKERFAMTHYFQIEENMKVKQKIDPAEYYAKYNGLCQFTFTLNVGQSIPIITNSLDRYGNFIIVADSLEELQYTKESLLDDFYMKVFK